MKEHGSDMWLAGPMAVRMVEMTAAMTAASTAEMWAGLLLSDY